MDTNIKKTWNIACLTKDARTVSTVYWDATEEDARNWVAEKVKTRNVIVARLCAADGSSEFTLSMV